MRSGYHGWLKVLKIVELVLSDEKNVTISARFDRHPSRRFHVTVFHRAKPAAAASLNCMMLLMRANFK